MAGQPHGDPVLDRHLHHLLRRRSPTKVSAFGAFRLALVKGKITPASLLRAVHGTCTIIMILIGVPIFGYFFTLTRVTQDLIAWVRTLPT